MNATPSRTRSIPIALALLVFGCANDTGGGERHRAHCADLAACEGGTVAECIEVHDAERDASLEVGCGAEWDALFACREATATCEPNGGFPIYAARGCDAEGNAYLSCL